MTISKLTSDTLREPDREVNVLVKLNEVIAQLDGTAADTTTTRINGDVGINVAPATGTELTVAPSRSGSTTVVQIQSGDGDSIVLTATNTTATLSCTNPLTVNADTKLNGALGFYNTAPIAQQTGVAVTAGGIHAALVALGLITA
jgi:hypothetical protein